MKRNYLVIITALLLAVAALLVFPREASDPVQNPEPDVTKPAVTTPAPDTIPAPEPAKTEPVKVPDPPKVEPTVAAGPQAGDPVLLVPHELWQYAVKTSDGGIGFRLPKEIKELSITMSVDVFVSPKLILAPFPVGLGSKETMMFEGIALTPSKEMKNSQVDMAIILPNKVNGRINRPVDPGQSIITINPVDRKMFFDGIGFDLLVYLGGGESLAVPDQVAKETDPYKYFRSMCELWLSTYGNGKKL